MSYVLDSSCLIYLGKLRILEKLEILEGKKFIPEGVYEEVVTKGIERNEPEAVYIEGLVRNKMFIVAKPREAISNIPLLSKADMEVLAVAKETKSICVIDEIYASDVAETFGIESHGTVYVLLKLLEKKALTKKETISHLGSLINLGFYLSAEMYREILDKIGEMK
ncbi:MAG: DUF3368 domain-containing protein [Candidatus Aenigmarchaeota archaeon]|nr:DUF3368 domain-containing protein [Candidatus Aenigmarchaeota archaeon]